MLDVGKTAILTERLELARQFAGDLFDRFRIEHLSSFRQRAERSAWATELLLHLLQFAALLDAAQGRDDGIEQEEQHVGAVLVEEEFAIAGAVAFGADVV